MLFHDYEPYASAPVAAPTSRGSGAGQDLGWAGLISWRARTTFSDYGVSALNLTTNTRRIRPRAAASAKLAKRGSEISRKPKGRVALSGRLDVPDSSRSGRTRAPAGRPASTAALHETTTITASNAARAPWRHRRGTAAGPGDRSTISAADCGRMLRAFAPSPQAVSRRDRRGGEKRAGLSATPWAFTHEGGRDRCCPRLPVDVRAAMVDAGADLFVGHGPHVLRGIEIYKGKPIMYSLGAFIFQNETLLRLPSENYEPLNLGPAAHVNDFNDARYDFDKSGFPADPPIWEAVVAAAIAATAGELA